MLWLWCRGVAPLLPRGRELLRNGDTRCSSRVGLSKAIQPFTLRKFQSSKEAIPLQTRPTLSSPCSKHYSSAASLSNLEPKYWLFSDSRRIAMVKSESDDPVVVLTDVDDTLTPLSFCKISLNDAVYKPREVYPGVSEFALQLSLLGSEISRSPRKVIVVSARLSMRRLRDHHPVVSLFRRCSEVAGLGNTWGIDEDLSSYFGFLEKASFWRGTATRKIENIEKLLPLLGRAKLVWIGDTGSQDEAVGEYLLRRHGDRLLGCFFRIVKGKQLQEEGKTPKVIYFRNYVEAATRAHLAGIWDLAPVRKIIITAIFDLFMYHRQGGRFENKVHEILVSIKNSLDLPWSQEDKVILQHNMALLQSYAVGGNLGL